MFTASSHRYNQQSKAKGMYQENKKLYCEKYTFTKVSKKNLTQMNLDTLVDLHIDGFEHKLSLFTHGSSELVSSFLIKDRIWEAFETKLFIDNIKAGDCILDIGANLGYYTCIASFLTGAHGKVLSFEPETTNFSLLQKNIAHNNLQNVETFHAGLGELSHESKLFINEKNRGDHRGFGKAFEQKSEIIHILKGDEIVPDCVNFIKIDTQGYELKILKGLRSCIQKNQQHLNMIVEFWPYALEQNGGSAEKLLEELEQYSFKVSIINHINHQLIGSDWEALKTLARDSLTPESQGFINLWLSSPKAS